jgi:hypothetical protein
MTWWVGDAARGADTSSLYALGMSQPGLTSPKTRMMKHIECSDNVSEFSPGGAAPADPRTREAVQDTLPIG